VTPGGELFACAPAVVQYVALQPVGVFFACWVGEGSRARKKTAARRKLGGKKLLEVVRRSGRPLGGGLFGGVDGVNGGRRNDTILLGGLAQVAKRGNSGGKKNAFHSTGSRRPRFSRGQARPGGGHGAFCRWGFQGKKRNAETRGGHTPAFPRGWPIYPVKNAISNY